MTNQVVVDVTVVDRHQVLIVQSNGGSGPTGPMGPQGAPGGATFTYVQSVPSSAWVINHNLGSLVHVTLLNSSGVQVEGDVTESSINTVVIMFNAPTTGTAVISP